MANIARRPPKHHLAPGKQRNKEKTLIHNDLRDWLKAVESSGEFKQITGAHWDLEMGSIVELVYREGKLPKPVILFDEVPGYPKGFRALFGLLGSTWQIAKTLGISEDQTEPLSVAENWYQKNKEPRSIPPEVVNSGPVLENTDTGKQIDVLKFPVPRFHELDRNRYFGTAHTVIQKDPDPRFHGPTSHLC